MWEFFKRLFGIFRSEAHSLADKLERPMALAKQGIRDLKQDLDKSLKSVAEVSAVAIRSRRETARYKQQMDDYEQKAMALLRRGQSGYMQMAEAERLATEALARREEISRTYQVSLANQKKYDAMETKVKNKIQSLKREIARWETELRTMEARLKAAEAGERLGKVMAGIDSSKTLEMLQRTKDRVEEAEARSEAYSELSDHGRSIDDEIDDALHNPMVSDALLEMKRKMGMVEEEKQEITLDALKERVNIKIEVDRGGN
ncbi:MAG: PspA/IM30 family protein [Saprospiraceae bacterium]|nr:PspA/IM30 family protein [Saprospiraceae bacterium]